MFIGNIEHNTIIPKIKLSCVSFLFFLVVGSSISTARTTVWNWTAFLKFYGSTKDVLFFKQSSQTRVLHEDM